MEFAPEFGAELVGHRLHQGASEQLVGPLIELADLGHSLEWFLVGPLHPVHPRHDLLEPALDKLDVIVHRAILAVDFVDLHAIESRRQCLDGLKHRDDLGMFLPGDPSRDKDPEVADVLVQQTDDRLAAGLDLIGGAIHVRHPVERLLRWGDVVAHGGEQDDRRLDGTKIEGLTVLRPSSALPQIVADEQVIDNPLNFLAVEEIEATPPALEVEEARRFGVDVGKQVVVLLPERVCGIQVLHVLDQISPIEQAIAKVGSQRRHPGPAERATGVSHRVVALALAPGPSPVGHGRAVDDDRPCLVGVRRGEHHRGPATLAVAHNHGLGAVGVQLPHLVHELFLRTAHVQQRLPGLGIREEDHEVDGMTFAQRHTNLGIVLEPADTGAVTGSRIDDHVRPALRVHGDALRRNDANQCVIDGAFEASRIEYHFVLEMQ